MKVIILGGGEIGRNIAKYLVKEGHEVSLIDDSSRRINEAIRDADVQGYVGHGTDPLVYERAGASDAELFIAMSDVDETNILACQICQVLYEVPTKIARVTRRSYLSEVWERMLRESMYVDHLISSEVEVARFIHETLKVEGAIESIPLSDGRVYMIGIRLEGKELTNTALKRLSDIFPDLALTVIGIGRKGKVNIARSRDELQVGDEVFFLVSSEDKVKAMEAFGKREEGLSGRVIIVGGGDIGVNIASLGMEEGSGRSYRIIERLRERALQLSEELSGVIVIRGDALDTKILEEAGIEGAGALLAVTEADETNILVNLLAKRYKVPLSLCLLGHMDSAQMFSSLDIDVYVDPREVTISEVLRYIRKGKVRSVHSVRREEVELLELETLKTSSIVGKSVGSAKFPKDSVVGGILRDGKFRRVDASTVIEEGDVVYIAGTPRSVGKIERMFSVLPDFF